MHHAPKNAPIIVYGEGSAAVFTIDALLQQNEHIIWAAGSGAKLLPVMPSVKSGLALATLIHSDLNHPVEKGLFHRIFRNKGFKLPAWKKATDLESQTQSYEEMVSPVEQVFTGVEEYKVSGLSLAALEQELREKLETHALVTRVASVPVVELEVFEHGGKIQFANGFITEFKQFFYCDSFAELKSIPKLMTVLKHQVGGVKSTAFHSALQVVFTHATPLLQSIESGLMIPLTRETGESADRHALGYFMEPTKSVWTVFLEPEEVEDNHEIMKKLRRLKQALNKAFDSPEFLPEGKKEFMATVQKEQVRFEKSYLAATGEFKTSVANADFVLLSDSFGFSAALERVANQFGYEAVEMDLHIESDDQHLATIPQRTELEHHFEHR